MTIRTKTELPSEIIDEIDSKGGIEKITADILTLDIRKISKLMGTLSNPIRIKILLALSHQRMCACILTDLTHCAPSKCSYHLSKLLDVGLIKSERTGNFITYSLTESGINSAHHILEHK